MFNLVLDIDYVVAALIILIVLYAFSRKKFFGITKANSIFYAMLFSAIITCIFDILMNVAITYREIFSDFSYMMFRLLFNCGTSLIAFLGYQYARMYQKDRHSRSLHVLDMLVIVIFAFYIILSVINIFTGIISYIDENGVYTHGPLFLVNTIAPAIIFLMVLFVIGINRKDYTHQQSLSVLAYFLITFSFVIIELLTNNIAPLTMFGIAISLVVVQQSLVSPEMYELEAALEAEKKQAEEAKIARAQAVEAQHEAEMANTAKSSFLARMSHEIRTPLNAVIGFNSIISREAADDSIKGYSADAKSAGENLLSLINDILDFSKIESGKLQLINNDYFTVNNIREEYLLFNLKAEEKGLKLVFDIDSKIPSQLYGDDMRIKQILTNLLSNSVKYTDKGEVKLSISVVQKANEKVTLKFEVSDTGRGIKAEDLSKLFDAFERIEEKKNRNIEGTGLGVNICASLLSMMGSKLQVESEYGKGSTFSFVIEQTIINDTPIGDFHPEESLIGEKDDEEADYVAAPAKILVVDDVMLNIKVFKGLLKNSNLEIDSAVSGPDALELTKLNKYDLIFMDHLMPDMDGIEAMVAIKSQSGGLNVDTPVIVLTANAIKGAYEEYLSYGFADAVFKPVKLKDLTKVLSQYVG